MARTPSIFITGASGEIGQALIRHLATPAAKPVITLDINPLPSQLACRVRKEFTGSILDHALMERILAEYEVDRIFHLAALLSTRSEFSPALAHKVNVEGTLNLLEFAQHQGESHGRRVGFFYPSSIAAYGMPDLATKEAAGAVTESQWNEPRTMYGANKLYCEHLGRYYDRYYRQLGVGGPSGMVDFRCMRFPGLISAVTVPSGGTSDFAPEMLHAAARGQPYCSFVRSDTRIPFMVMPDAVDAILRLMAADKARLRQAVYNVRGFSVSAAQVETLVRSAFPNATITTVVDQHRQAILDSWPADVDDHAAREDWGFQPRFDFNAAFHEYLIPGIQQPNSTV